MSRGRVVLVGAGPGDPELITLKGLRELETADAVLYDRLVSKELVTRARSAVIVRSVGKEPGGGVGQEEINEMLVELASRGLKVVRLKGGDPYTFGRGEEECIHVLSRGIPCTVVPGVPSYTAAAAYAGIPLAGRDFASSFAVVTGREAPGKPGGQRVRIGDVARAVDTLVVLMGVARAPSILGELLRVRGPASMGAVVENATLSSQRVVVGTLEELGKLALDGVFKPPAIMFFGSAVGMREVLWRASPAFSY